MPHYFYENKWGVLGVGTVLYLLMFLFMGVATDIYTVSPFFNVKIGGDAPLLNPQILGVPITTTGQFIIFMLFFFINTFFSVWLRVLIIDRYGLLINDSDKAVKNGITKQYPPQLFWSYNLWKSFGTFFSILGIFSNVFFFGSTVFGAFLGNVLSRRFLIGLDDLEHEKQNLVAARYNELRPLTSIGGSR